MMMHDWKGDITMVSIASDGTAHLDRSLTVVDFMLNGYVCSLAPSLLKEDVSYNQSYYTTDTNSLDGWNSNSYPKFLPFEPHLDADGDETDEKTCEGTFLSIDITDPR